MVKNTLIRVYTLARVNEMISRNNDIWTLSANENFSWNTRIKFPSVFLQFFGAWHITLILIRELLDIILRASLIDGVHADLSS